MVRQAIAGRALQARWTRDGGTGRPVCSWLAVLALPGRSVVAMSREEIYRVLDLPVPTGGWAEEK